MRPDGRPLVYFNGNSLGLMPRGARELVEQELDAWADQGVEGHFQGSDPWFSYHELFRESGARLVGAGPGEVVMMNSLTVNLHLHVGDVLPADAHRYKILIEDRAFPSDMYAVHSQIGATGSTRRGAPRREPRAGEATSGRRTSSSHRIAGRPRSRSCSWAGCSTSRASSSTCEAITEAAHRRGASSGSISPTRRGTCRSGFTTGTSISRCGARTST